MSATETRQTKPPVKTVRLNINVSENTAAILRRLAEDRGSTITDVVRLAVALLDLVETEQAKGNEIQLVDGKGEVAQRLRLLG